MLTTATDGTGLNRNLWRHWFRTAFRGIKLALRSESSFAVLIFGAVGIIAAGIVLRISPLEWCSIVSAIVAVFSAELLRSAVKFMAHLSGIDRRPEGQAPYQIATAMVLVVSLGAITITAIVFMGCLKGLMN